MDIEKLLLAKFLLKKGESLLDPDDPMSSALAISLFQDAAELVLWTVASRIEAGIGERDGFAGIWDKINKKCTEHSLPLKEKMFELNKARVGFKHYGILPTTSLARKHYGYVADFISSVVKQYFDNDFTMISLADIVRDEGVRKHLKEAEEYLRQGDQEQALVSCELANKKLYGSLKHALPEISWSMENFGERLRADNERDDIRSGWSEIITFLKDLRATTAFSILGVNAKDLVRYKRFTPRVNVTLSGNVFTVPPAKNGSAADVQFCIDFVTTTAIHAQTIGLGETNVARGPIGDFLNR